MKNEITITREQFFEFVKGKNEDEKSESPKYFLDYFDNYKKSGKKGGFNGAAFFFTYLWFLYRRMYFYAVIIFLLECTFYYFIDVGIQFLHDTFINQTSAEIIYGCLRFLFSSVLSDCANYIYLLYANKKTSSGTLRKGTNIWIVLLAVILILIAIMYKYRQFFGIW